MPLSSSPGDQHGIYRRTVMDPKRHRFHNKAAVGLTIVTLVLLVTLSLIFGEDHSSGNDSGRYLEDNNDNNNDDYNGDYSAFSCRYIYDKYPDPGAQQCSFARTCNGGEGVWAPWVFCHYDRFTVKTLFLMLSPVMLLWMMTLFRLLGSTAEDYFSPSLEMFSVKLGLPPRFAGVSLLALGNGAADVSATMSAIENDEENGYKLSLGALSGAAMMVGGVIAAIIVLVAGGVPCRGALVRDVMALLVTVVVVWRDLSSGEIGPSSVTLYLSMYFLFVCLVLVADIYHRKVVLPRLAAVRGEGNTEGEHGEVPAGPNAVQRVISTFSNYDNVPADETAPHASEEEDNIILHGPHGILHGNGSGVSSSQSMNPTEDENGGAYALLENHIDTFCAGDGSHGVSATNWTGASYDCRQEIMQHFYQAWEDAVWNGDINAAEKFMLICEFPFTILRKASIPIPCEGYYNRGVIALSIGMSPLWFAFYMYSGHDTNLLAGGWVVYFLIYWGLAIFVASLICRYAPGGESYMPMGVATPIALYGFVIAATWIDFVADSLVSLLDFVGIVLHIPGAIMGLTILAWGNSMADLSANVTMARKGLANMAMTACFAGPVFNILVGLGLGFSGLATQTGNEVKEVSLSAPVETGFVFIILNCICIITCGVVVGKGRIDVYYGYVALGLYAIYICASIGIQFSKYAD
mmetsp:Transcript_122591/g.183350  ORF Transcript_122591/g.183350 Transcript_122591/m.183350 type:complete len:692 (-) Transcript_122591:226-2301(-)|eukprot:CAMPEP_0117023238 /NCGR_PEP_ID=MMETSP0472-20121206/17362_1 /TAXON_ID=693140 ORGANISM="Tiarina fusus, Strain LIS" /NCGR_SAMPLE_ID=MMETSP0472 /ASSEMBLY_ACC=CAM_ASM_000603 /LENGTH=691 /DNA_ID=CAMNT_0004729295 /DNA_START=101 /DNA_END=2176 /DNA_ORIENTATION=+